MVKELWTISRFKVSLYRWRITFWDISINKCRGWEKKGRPWVRIWTLDLRVCWLATFNHRGFPIFCAKLVVLLRVEGSWSRINNIRQILHLQIGSQICNLLIISYLFKFVVWPENWIDSTVVYIPLFKYVNVRRVNSFSFQCKNSLHNNRRKEYYESRKRLPIWLHLRNLLQLIEYNTKQQCRFYLKPL